MPEELCPACGKPLHYTSPDIQSMVQRLIDHLGYYQQVVGPDGRKWRVPRHYIGLHGIKADDLPHLGFEEVKPD